VAGGGLPIDLVRVEVKLTFKDGGHSDFQTKFELIKDRLRHAQDLERETGQVLNVTDEPLPPYEARRPATESGGPPRAAASGTGDPSNPGQTPQPGPDEPPPDYLEAQSQAVGMQYEERTREEAERH
jgi:hypothetical protein